MNNCSENRRRVTVTLAASAAGVFFVCAAALLTPARAEAASVSDEERMRGFATYVQEQDLAGGVVGFGDFSDIGEGGENIPNMVAGDSRMQGMLDQMRAMEAEYGPLIQDKVTVISKRDDRSGRTVRMEDARMSEMSTLAQDAAALAVDLEEAPAEQVRTVQDPVMQTPEEIIRLAEQQVLGGGLPLLTHMDLEKLRREVSGTLSGDTFPTTNWRRFGEDLISLGDFTLTAYDPCEICCGKTDGITATGTHGKAGRTIAVDPSIIPYGSRVLVGGYVFIAEDTGSAIRGRHIDLFMDTHEVAMQFGRREGEVFLIR
ncbi:MAG: 3D domain-containing protein [Lachnospiraceae bacterium]|nr:3D domain-containing protein [Lachnospiraceae bacterium]